MGLGQLVELRWGTNYANALLVELPLDEPRAYSRPRAGSEFRQFASGVEDAWIPGTDAIVEGDVRSIPTVDLPVAGWGGFARDVAIATAPSGTGGTSLVLTGGAGATFPAVSAPYFFYGVLEQSGVREAVQVTARATDTLTLVRGQLGTVAATFTTAARFLAFPQLAAGNGWDGATGWDEFLRWGAAKNVIRFYPSRVLAPTTYRECYLVAPIDGEIETRENNYRRRIRLVLRATDGLAFTGF